MVSGWKGPVAGAGAALRAGVVGPAAALSAGAGAALGAALAAMAAATLATAGAVLVGPAVPLVSPFPLQESSAKSRPAAQGTRVTSEVYSVLLESPHF